jgi:hypothetical protein
MTPALSSTRSPSAKSNEEKEGSIFMATAAETKRTASVRLNNNENPTFVRVSLPHKITEPELSKLINEGIVKNIIAKHTGCTCLSGRINVLIESEFQEAVIVDLSSQAR